jgi:hypothetical protein
MGKLFYVDIRFVLFERVNTLERDKNNNGKVKMKYLLELISL